MAVRCIGARCLQVMFGEKSMLDGINRTSASISLICSVRGVSATVQTWGEYRGLRTFSTVVDILVVFQSYALCRQL